MFKRIFIILIFLFSCKRESFNTIHIESVTAVDTYHGQEIIDHYRNIENLEDSVVIHWLKNQADFATKTLNNIPGKQKILDKLLSYESKEEYSYDLVRYSSNGKYFYTKTKTQGNESPKVYYRSDLKDEEIMIFDLSKYAPEEQYLLSYLKPDWEGNKLAIGLVKKGEELANVIVIDVKSKKVLPGVVKKCLLDFAGVHWLSDDSGFIYLYSPITDPTDKNYWTNMKSLVYTINSDPDDLIDIFSRNNNPELKLKPEDFPIVYNYDAKDGYLFAVVGGANSFYDVYYARESDLLSKSSPWISLYRESDMIKQIRVDKNDNLVFLSAKNASNGRICITPMSNPNFENPEILVEEKKNQLITKFHNTKDGLYFSVLKNGVEERLFRLEKEEEIEIQLPKPVGEMNIQSQSIDQDFLKISAGGYITPWTHYLYDLDSHQFSIEPIVPVKDYPEFNDLIVQNLEIPSHDGVMVPISIISRKNVKKDRSNPTLLYGYGSYGGAGGASFNPNFLTWVTEGGILVFAHVRGGGEKGESWHKAGFKATKPNTWKDMIATTEYVIKEGYTNSEKTAIWGSSAGGILAGRAMTERPDLYSAVVLTSPATNMLRSEIQPNGQNSVKEFGSVKIKEEFKALLEMDSYHHIKKGVSYPATLVTGGMKDGRVVIWDPAKFVAKLQSYNKSKSPILFKVKFDGGHGSINSSKLEYYELYADSYAFILWQLGYEGYQPK